MQANSGDLILKALTERRERNPSYSLRALARDVGVSHVFLSNVANGKKRLPPTMVALLEGRQKNIRLKKSSHHSQFETLSVDQFTLISEWYHFAILELLTLKNAKQEMRWLAQSLGITVFQVRLALSRLERLGYLQKVGTNYQVLKPKTSVPTSRAHRSLFLHQKQMMKRAEEAMYKTDPLSFENREISGMTMAISRDKVQIAKRKIKKFKRDMEKLLSNGDCDDVFQLNIQFFSLLKKAETK